MSSDNDIPVVSFAPFLSGSVVDREQTASAIDVALKSDGFLYLTDHGINQDKIDTLFQLVSLCSYRLAIVLPAMLSRCRISSSSNYLSWKRNRHLIPQANVSMDIRRRGMKRFEIRYA